jgi:CPA1 family monovalent cation:H+ antiporter
MEGRVSPPVFMKLEKENNERNEQANRQLDELYKKHPELLQEQEFTARKSCFTPSTRSWKDCWARVF